jgi:hypothetical protein
MAKGRSRGACRRTCRGLRDGTRTRQNPHLWLAAFARVAGARTGPRRPPSGSAGPDAVSPSPRRRAALQCGPCAGGSTPRGRRPISPASPCHRVSRMRFGGRSNPTWNTASPANVSRSPPDARRTTLCPGVWPPVRWTSTPGTTSYSVSKGRISPRLVQRLRTRPRGGGPCPGPSSAGAGGEPRVACGHSPVLSVRLPCGGRRRRLSLGTGPLGVLTACLG